MAKIQINSKKYCSFGGIFSVKDVFNRTLSDAIDNFLGQRGETAKAYSYSEMFSALFCNYLCGGDFLEDLNKKSGGKECGVCRQVRTRISFQLRYPNEPASAPMP